MAAECRPCGVFVHARLLQQEVGLDRERNCHRPVGLQLLLQVLLTLDRLRTLALVLVVLLLQLCVPARARLVALRLDLLDLAAVLQGLALDVVRALRHGLRLAQVLVALVTAGDHALALEPVPWGADLAAIATHAGAVDEPAAACGVCDGEEGGLFTCDAEAVFECFGSAVGPARAAVTLVAGVVDVGAVRPFGFWFE